MLPAGELHNRYGCLDSILLLEFKLASAGVAAVADMNTKCGEVSSFGAELAHHYEWKPPTWLITMLSLHLDYLTFLLLTNLWNERIGHQLAVERVPGLSQMLWLVLASVSQMGKHQGRGLAVWQTSELGLDVNCISTGKMPVLVLCPEQDMSLQQGVEEALLHTSTCLRDWVPAGTALQGTPGVLLFQATQVLPLQLLFPTSGV